MPHGVRRRRDGLVRDVSAGATVQTAEELDHAHPIGQGVMRLEQVGRPPTGQTLDQRRFPKRPAAIERSEQESAHHAEQGLALGSGPDQLTSQVVAQVEVVVVDPRRRPGRQKGLDAPLSHARDELRRPGVGGGEPLGLRRAVENEQGGNGRGLLRMPLGPPHRGLELVEVGRAAPGGGLAPALLVGGGLRHGYQELPSNSCSGG